MSDTESTKEMKRELTDYREIFDRLQPFIVLAINDYYFGEDKNQIEQKIKDLGYNLP